MKANNEMIIRSLKKFGITTAVDGSEDDQVNVEGIKSCVMLHPKEEFHLETSSSEEREEEESDSTSYDIFSLTSDSSSENS